MTRHELPDDPARWPRDPYRLLGITRGTAARDVRLAYTRLIRRYKPEQFPEHFRRIRAAYEATQQNYSFHAADYDEIADLNEPPTESHGDSPFPQDAASHDESTADRAVWSEACDGDRLAAYRRLTQLQTRDPTNWRAFAQLYWLLTVEPALDSTCGACDWLVRGLSNGNWNYCLAGLYEREITVNPLEAMSPRFRTLVESCSNAAWLIELLSSRWNTLAGHDEAYEIIAGDLESSRPTLGNRPDDWLVVLVSALKHLIWLNNRDFGWARRRYRAEIDELDIAPWRFGEELAQLDFCEVVVAECLKQRRRNTLSTLSLHLIEANWRFELSRSRDALAAWSRVVVNRPRGALAYFDQLHGHSPLILHQLAESVTQLSDIERPLSADKRLSLEPTVFAFFDRARPGKFKRLRRDLLDFCVYESFSAGTVAAVMLGQRESLGSGLAALARKIRNDQALGIVIAAHLVLGS